MAIAAIFLGDYREAFSIQWHSLVIFIARRQLYFMLDLGMKLCFKILILSYSGEVMIIIILCPGRPWLGYASEHTKRPSSYDIFS